MLRERFVGILEEISEVQTLAELQALIDYGDDYADIAFGPAFQAQAKSLEGTPTVFVPEGPTQAPPPVKQAGYVRSGRRYVLLSVDVSWSTKPQVHALMSILAAHLSVGDEVEEVAIVEMMVANEHVLETRQGGKRIWDYYKGDHAEGLTAHGNVRKV